MRIACKAVETRLPSLDESGRLPERLAKHTASCLRCQAEAARYRSLRRSLGSLAARLHPAPADLAAAVEARLDGVPASDSTAPVHVVRVAAAAGAVVAAAGTVAMIRWMRARSAA